MALTHPKDMVKETSGWRTRRLAASVPIHSVQQQPLSCGGELCCTQEEPEAFPEQPSSYPQGRGLVPGPAGRSQNVQSKSNLLMALRPQKARCLLRCRRYRLSSRAPSSSNIYNTVHPFSVLSQSEETSRACKC